MVLEAQAKKESRILEAEAIKEAAIREAEGQAEAIRMVKQATADGIRMLVESQPNKEVIASAESYLLRKGKETESPNNDYYSVRDFKPCRTCNLLWRTSGRMINRKHNMEVGRRRMALFCAD